MKILISQDGSESADEIFADLKAVGLSSDAEAIVDAVGGLLIFGQSDEDYLSVIPSQRVAAAIKKREKYTVKLIEEIKAIAEQGKIKSSSTFDKTSADKNRTERCFAWKFVLTSR